MHQHDHHTHEHGCGHSHAHLPEEIKEQVALLAYMLHHNEHHLEELHEAAHSIEDEGDSLAAGLLHEAVALYDAANKKLASALDRMKKED